MLRKYIAGAAFAAIICMFFLLAESAAASDPDVFFPGMTWEQVESEAGAGLGVKYVAGGKNRTGWDSAGYVDSIRKAVCGTPAGLQGRQDEVLDKIRMIGKGNSVKEYRKLVEDGVILPGDIIQARNKVKGIHVMIAGESMSVYHAWCSRYGTLRNSFAAVWAADGPSGYGIYSSFRVYRGLEERGNFVLRMGSRSGISPENAVFCLLGKGTEYRLVTSGTGGVSLGGVPAGEYVLVQEKAAEGCLCMEEKKHVSIAAGKTASVSVPMIPMEREAEGTEDSACEKDLAAGPEAVENTEGADDDKEKVEVREAEPEKDPEKKSVYSGVVGDSVKKAAMVSILHDNHEEPETLPQVVEYVRTEKPEEDEDSSVVFTEKESDGRGESLVAAMTDEVRGIDDSGEDIYSYFEIPEMSEDDELPVFLCVVSSLCLIIFVLWCVRRRKSKKVL